MGRFESSDIPLLHESIEVFHSAMTTSDEVAVQQLWDLGSIARGQSS